MRKEKACRFGIMVLFAIISALCVAGCSKSLSKSNFSADAGQESMVGHGRLPLNSAEDLGQANHEAGIAAQPARESWTGTWWQKIRQGNDEFRQAEDAFAGPFPDEPDTFPFSSNADDPVVPYAVDSLRIPISGTSRTASELADEVSAGSYSKVEAFAQMRELAHEHPEARIREQAITYLAGTANDVTFSSIIESLTDPDRGVRQRAMELLLQLGDRVPVQKLTEMAARSQDPAVRAEVDAFVEEFTSRFPQLQQHLYQKEERR